MKAVILKTTTQTVKVKNNDGVLSSTSTPITLKNEPVGLTSLKQIPDVVETSLTDGATLIYNSTLDIFEVKQISLVNITIDQIDGGSF